MTKPTKWPARPAKTRISLGVRPVRSESSLSESSLSAWRQLGLLATHWTHSEDTDLIGRMSRLSWVFAGCTGDFVGFVMLRLNYNQSTTLNAQSQNTGMVCAGLYRFYECSNLAPGFAVVIKHKFSRSRWSTPNSLEPGAVARSKRPRVRSPRPAHSFVEIRSWKKFYGYSPSSADSRRAVVSQTKPNRKRINTAMEQRRGFDGYTGAKQKLSVKSR